MGKKKDSSLKYKGKTVGHHAFACFIKTVFFLCIVIIPMFIPSESLQNESSNNEIYLQPKDLSQSDQEKKTVDQATKSSDQSSKAVSYGKQKKSQIGQISSNIIEAAAIAKEHIKLEPVKYNASEFVQKDITWNQKTLGTMIDPSKDLKKRLANAEMIQDFKTFSIEMSTYISEDGKKARKKTEKYYMIDEVKNFKIYGNGRLNQLLIGISGQFIYCLDLPYTTCYGTRPSFCAYDYDDDGIVELSMIIPYEYGSEVKVDRLFMLDQKSKIGWTLYQFTEDLYKKDISEHVSYGKKDNLQLYLNKRPVGRVLDDIVTTGEVGISHQIQMSNEANQLSIDAMFAGSQEGKVTYEMIPYHISSQIRYLGNGDWELFHYSFSDHEISDAMYDLVYAYYLPNDIAKLSQEWQIDSYAEKGAKLGRSRVPYSYDKIQPLSISYDAAKMNDKVLKITISVRIGGEEKLKYLFVRLNYKNGKKGKQGKWIVNWVSEYGEITPVVNYCYEGTDFTCNGYVFNMKQRKPELLKISNVYQLGSYIMIEGHIPGEGLYCAVFSIRSFCFETEFMASCFTYYDTIQSFVYCYENKVYNCNGDRIKELALAKGETIDMISYTSDGSMLDIDIWKNGEFERTEQISADLL